MSRASSRVVGPQSAGMIDAGAVARAHDAMVAEYDLIEDLWYAHLLNRVHRFIVDRLPPRPDGTALDVGCGTGFQSLLLAYAGYRVRGFDLAQRLVERAKQKAGAITAGGPEASLLFTSSLPDVMAEQEATLRTAVLLRRGPAVAPDFFVGDATEASSYAPGGFHVVVCCGSVLSFIDQYDETLALAADAMRPGGMLFLEVEQRVNCDLLWPIADMLLGGWLRYDQDLRTVLKNLLARRGRHVRVDYPFALGGGREVVLPLWLFSVGALKKQFRRLGLIERAHLGVHAATNLIPSTVLHRPGPSERLQRVFDALAAVDERWGERWPLWRLGCSVVFALEKG